MKTYGNVHSIIDMLLRLGSNLGTKTHNLFSSTSSMAVKVRKPLVKGTKKKRLSKKKFKLL